MRRLIGLLMMVGLVVGVGCGDDDSSPTSSSVSQDKYSETIVGGTWKDGGEPIWTFNADGTVVYDGYEDYIYTWSIDGSTLTVFNPVKSDQDLLVGTWLDEDGDSITLRSNGTFVDWDEDEGTWSLVGDQLTIAYNDEDYGSDTVTLNSVTDTQFTVTDEYGERYVNTKDGDDDDEDGEVFARYEITSLSNTEFVFVDPEYPDIKTTLTR